MENWKDWGKRFRAQIAEKGLNLAKIAERMDMAESTLRSWTNGNREINLSDFFRLCAAADIEPANVLFIPSQSVQKSAFKNENLGTLARAWEQASPIWREQLLTTAEAILKSRGAARPK